MPGIQKEEVCSRICPADFWRGHCVCDHLHRLLQALLRGRPDLYSPQEIVHDLRPTPLNAIPCAYGKVLSEPIRCTSDVLGAPADQWERNTQLICRHASAHMSPLAGTCKPQHRFAYYHMPNEAWQGSTGSLGRASCGSSLMWVSPRQDVTLIVIMCTISRTSSVGMH